MEQNLTIPLRYCLYARKSAESDEKQALSIDSQINEMTKVAEANNLNIVEIYKESHSAKDSGQRPIFNQIIENLREQKFNALLTWNPDRLSRNAGDLGSLVDLMDQKLLLEIRTYNQKFINSPNEKFLLMILCSQAKLENDNKSINVKRGLRASVEKGLWPSPAPFGYLNENKRNKPGYIIPDPQRAIIVKQIYEKVAYEHWSGRKLYNWLKNDLNLRSKKDKYLSLSNIYIILKNTFYYGRFEYPRASGNWYDGKYKPIISKSLFEDVQSHLEKKRVTERQDKEFAFTKLMKCGSCNSGITAQDKFKKLNDGTIKKYIYYGCTRGKDKKCKERYIEEKELIKQLVGLVDKISLNKLGIKEKIELELERYNKFRYGVLGLKKEEEEKQKNIDIKNYAKYILKNGNIYEKRDLLSCLRSRLVLKDRKIFLSD